MSMAFLHPLLLLLAPLAAWLWWGPARGRDRVQTGLRTSVMLALILALAQPVWLGSDARTFHVFVVDRTASVGLTPRTRARDRVMAMRAALGARAQAALVVVGDPPAEGAAPLDAAAFGSTVVVRDAHSTTALGAALAAAARQVPEGATGVIHLFTDGLATDRRWAPEVQQIVERRIAIEAWDLGYDERDVYPAGLTSRELLRVGQTARIDVDVTGLAKGLRVRLRDADGQELAASGPIDSDGRVVVPLTFEPRAAGFLAVTAEVAADRQDVNPANNTIARTFAVQDPLRVLYLGDRVQGGARAFAALVGRGFDVRDGDGQVRSGGADLSGYDLVMLDDRPASLVPRAVQDRIEQAVAHEGLGLIVSGGRSSFGTGGYDGTPIATIAPVEFVQRTEKRDPSASLAIIIDTSGSMMGTRIELAKQVARLAVRRLKAHDRIGIVEFYGNKHWALPMQSAANKITIDRAIGRMQAIGGTVMLPAIEEAYYGLKNVDTRYKHILIVTDGGVESADFETLARQIAKDGINLSTALVGAGQSQTLIDLASWGKGRFYAVPDRYNLPEVVLKQPSTMKLPAYKTGAFGVDTRGGEGWWSDIDRRSLPTLDGYVETTARDGAEDLMTIAGTGDPLLSSWRFGLGRVTALMTEPVGEGTRGWAGWREYGRLLARIVSRTADDTRLFDYAIRRADHEVTVTARRTGRDATLAPDAEVLGDAGRPSRPLAFREIAPGTFTATWAIDPDASIRILASARASSAARTGLQPTRLVSIPLDDVSAERQVDPERGMDLEALATATGGAYVEPERLANADVPAAPQALAASDVAGSLSATRLWPGLLLAALILYLAEIVWRRWPRATRGVRA